MREILFRGKRLDTGEWILGGLIKVKIGKVTALVIFNPDFAFINGEVKSLDHANVDPATVGQYTGLQDKNGKKIFEGDIWDCGGCIGVIKWEEVICSFEAHYVMHGIEYANAVSDYRAAKVEVIGNIHDNPELIGGDTP